MKKSHTIIVENGQQVHINPIIQHVSWKWSRYTGQNLPKSDEFISHSVNHKHTLCYTRLYKITEIIEKIITTTSNKQQEYDNGNEIHSEKRRFSICLIDLRSTIIYQPVIIAHFSFTHIFNSIKTHPIGVCIMECVSVFSFLFVISD